MRDCLHWKELNHHHKDFQMAATKKKPESKKNEPKKTSFFPKVKSTKKNGLGSY